MSHPLLIRALSVALSVGLSLALAILGAGGLDAYFADPARTALVVVTLALGVASLFVGGNLSSGLREDRGNRWVIAAFLVIGLLGAYLPAWADREGLWRLDGDAIRWFGVVLLGGRRVAAVAGRRARAPLQRPRRHSAGPRTRHHGTLQPHQTSELSRLADLGARLGTGLQHSGRCPHGVGEYSAACRADERRGTPVELGVRLGLCGLSRPNGAAYSGRILACEFWKRTAPAASRRFANAAKENS